MYDSKTYPFVSCLHPKRITNPYTHEKIIVPCGHCEKCQTRKAGSSALKCRLESLGNKFCYFITLTYRQDTIPLMTALPDGKHRYNLLNITERCGSGLVCGNVEMSYLNMRSLVNKCNVGGYLPYLSKRDLQLFIKRLRKNLSNYSNEKVRYYACGEYGPVHFRPHFHILLFFDSKEIQSHLSDCLYQSWTFGRIDSSISRGDCSTYVAGYLNGSCNLPSIFDSDECKPFSCHSFFLGEKILRSEKEKVYEMSPQDFKTRSIPFDGSYTNVNMWRSFEATYFPRCKNYNGKSSSLRLFSYRMYATVQKWLGKDVKPYVASRYILNYMLVKGDSHPIPLVKELLNYFLTTYRIHPFMDDDELISFRRSIYMELSLSYHFLYFCCDDTTYSECSKKLLLIDNYYKSLDYDNLTNQLYIQMEYINHDGDINDLVYMYNNIPNDISNIKALPIYKEFYSEAMKHYRDSFKHKALNDANKILYNF